MSNKDVINFNLLKGNGDHSDLNNIESWCDFILENCEVSSYCPESSFVVMAH